MKKQRKRWLAGMMAAVLTVSVLGGCSGGAENNTTAAGSDSQGTTAASGTQSTTAAQDTTAASGETQAPAAESDLASVIRGNTAPTDEEIARVNTTLDDSYLGDFYGLTSDYSAYPVAGDVTLDIWMPNNYSMATLYPDLSEHPVFKQIEALTGIHLNFIVPTQGEEKTEMNLLLAGKELPDIIMSVPRYYNGGLTAAVEDGLIIDLTEYEDKLPNYMGFINNSVNHDSLSVDTVTDDHRRLAVYELLTAVAGIPYGLVIKTKAMEDTGWTEVPETIDEWHSFLTDCKNAGYNIPLVFGSSTGFISSGYSCISSAFGVYSGMFVGDDGKVAWGPVQDGLESYLETMHQWYEEGLIDPDFATGDAAHRQSLTASDDCAVAFNAPTSVANLIHGTVEEDVVVTPYPVINKGDQPAIEYRPAYYGANYSASITTQCDNIDAALAFLDFGFSKKGWEIYGMGSYGDVHLIDEDGRPYYHDNSLIRTDEEIVGGSQDARLSKYRIHHSACAYSDVDSSPTASPVVNELIGKWTWGSKMVALPTLSMTSEESSRITDISNDIATARNEYLLKIITGQLPISAAAEFREQVQQMGLDTLVSVYQDAYDRCLAR